HARQFAAAFQRLPQARARQAGQRDQRRAGSIRLALNFSRAAVDPGEPRASSWCRRTREKEMPMSTNVIAMVLLAVSAAAPAADVKSTDSFNGTAAFSRLKSLAGEWEADGPMGKMHTSFELIAGGTAIVEHERHDQMPEMMTVYHMDGK